MKPTAKRPYDVLALGCAAVDDILYVPTFPHVDGKVKVARRSRQFGGLTGASLVTAARLGARCAYAGRLGNEEFSREITANFLREGVDVSLATIEEEAGVVHSVIVVAEDTGSRTIFYELCGSIGAHPSRPDAESIRDAAVLFIDHYGMEGNLRAAQLARGAGVAVVSDFEDDAVPHFDAVLALVDHLILSEEMACQISGKATAKDAAAALWHDERSAVVVTCGVEGCWSVTRKDGLELRHHAAFLVPVRDTTGCGDVFHGAYSAALAKGESLEARLDFASAAAALRASQPGIPDLAAVEAFLSSHPAIPRHSHPPL